MVHTVPTVFRELAAPRSCGTALPSLRLIALGGDTIRLRDVELYRRPGVVVARTPTPA